MPSLATTRLSSKGQVVIPDEVRTRLGLAPGAQFVVVGDGDVVILKLIAPPSMRDFQRLLRKARVQAHRAGLKKSDVNRAVRKARRGR